MGGDAFAQAVAQGEARTAPHMPRMDPETYAILKVIYEDRLADSLPNANVIPYKEAPEKIDHGDIDFFVATLNTVNFEVVAQQIGAYGYILRGPHKASFAVRQDGQPSQTPVRYIESSQNRPTSDLPVQNKTQEAYAQVDLAIISPDEVAWQTFMSAYADLSGIIGNMIRNVGFTLNHSGLYLRLAELDEAKTKDYLTVPDIDGKIFLTDDPSALIEFLGLDIKTYEAGFDRLEDMYTWLAECDYLYAEAIAKKRDISRDRRKAKCRPVFKNFFEEWLPQNRSAFAAYHLSTKSTNSNAEYDLSQFRLNALHNALTSFDKQQEYDEKHNKLIRLIDNGTAAHLLKAIIESTSGKQGSSLNEVLRAFRRWVGFNESGKPLVLADRHADQDSQLFRLLNKGDRTSIRDQDFVTAWVAEHWEEVRGLERKRT